MQSKFAKFINFRNVIIFWKKIYEKEETYFKESSKIQKKKIFLLIESGIFVALSSENSIF